MTRGHAARRHMRRQAAKWVYDPEGTASCQMKTSTGNRCLRGYMHRLGHSTLPACLERVGSLGPQCMLPTGHDGWHADLVGRSWTQRSVWR